MNVFENLITQPSATSVAPETLEMLGRKAATMYLQQGVSLNDSVQQLIAQEPGLNNEHVRRIIEFANNNAFQELFQNSEDKNVHFDVADPGVIIRDMKDGGSPAHDGKMLSEGKKDFMAPPRTQGDMGDMELSQAFAPTQESTNSGPMAKIASGEEIMEVPHAMHTNPVEDVYDAHVRLQAVRDDLGSQNDQAEMLLKQARDDLYDAIKHEILDHDGAGLGGVIGALEKVAASTKIAAVLPDMIQRLVGEGIRPQELERSLVKVAGVVVNPNHPIIVAWKGMEKAAYDRAVFTIALQNVDKSLEDSHSFLRSAHRL